MSAWLIIEAIFAIIGFAFVAAVTVGVLADTFGSPPRRGR